MIPFVYCCTMILHYMIQAWFCMNMLEPKYGKLRTYIFLTLMCGGALVAAMLVQAAYQSYETVVLQKVLSNIADVLSVVILFNGKRLKKVFVYIVKWTVFAFCDFGTVTLMGFMLPGYSYKVEFTAEATVTLLCFNVIAFTISTMLIPTIKRKTGAFNQRSAFVFFVFPLLQMLSTFLCGVYFTNFSLATLDAPGKIIFVFVQVLIFACNIFVIDSFDNFTQKQFLSNKLEAMELAKESDYQYYTLAKQHVDEMSLIRHDFKDHLNAVGCLIKSYGEMSRG